MDWWKNAGGGTSTGGVYPTSGTIGQPDAGQASGGQFAVAGGFWGIVAVVQTTNAPLLSITLNPQLLTITVSWPSPSTGWSPQQNFDLDTTNWVTPPETVNDNGTNKFLLIAPPAGNRFYRLTR